MKTMKTSNWAYALENGFYFSRAKYLGMKAPTAATVDAFCKDFDTLSQEEQQLVIDYHTAFKDAEVQASSLI